MGTVGVAGAFAGLDVVTNASSVSFDPETASLLSRTADGSLSKIASTNTGGSIFAGCAIDDVFYFAGSFSSVGETTASNVASFAGGSVAALGVNAPNGVFTSPGSAVAVWDVASKAWSAAPFGGLPGASSQRIRRANNTNNPAVPFSTGATPFTSSLVPIPLQDAEVDAGPSTTQTGFSNISNILCPAGVDGAGSTWFGSDGGTAVITVRKFSFLSAVGIRLGNTFLNGRGTTAFSVATIPDNAVQTLTYVDPADNKNKTCTNSCPLSTDSSVLYQDFLFDADLDITGFQLTLSGFQGAGPGLHILQLLSSGAFASAVPDDNLPSCFAPVASNTTMTGTWTQKRSSTSISGTTQTVLVADVDANTSVEKAPSFTWQPYVSASGEYQVNMLVPGCTNFQDCDLRTTVSVHVFPGENMDPWVTDVDQTNKEDKTTLIYSGPIFPTTPDFVTTVSMALNDDTTKQVEMVADRIQFILTSANTTSTSSSSSNSTASISNRGFGFIEWPLGSSATTTNNSAIPTAAITSLDNAGFDLFNDLGGSTSLTGAAASIAAVGQHPSGMVFLGGKFSLSNGTASGANNIMVFKNGALAALPNGGLNGAVTSLVVDGDLVFVGGSFSDTAQPSNSALRGIAAYSVSSNSWQALDGGLNGGVTSLDIANNQLLMTGNFTQVFTSTDSGSGQDASGLAAWDIANKEWTNSGGFLIGSMTFVGNGTSSDTEFVAGSVSASLGFGASGFVTIQNGKNGEPEITPLAVSFNGASSSSNSSSNARRSHHRRTPTGWISNIVNVFKRATTSTNLAPLPSAPSASAPAVLAGAFWTNSSSSKDVIIIGGNFSYIANGVNAQNIAVYDDAAKTVTALKGSQPKGVVRSLLVSGDSLFVGGEFSIDGLSTSGFALYNLATQVWDMSGVDSLQGSDGAAVVVRSISKSTADGNQIIVAGSFAQAGSAACRAVCSLDSTTRVWAALGNGIQGDVSNVVYSGSEALIVGGSIALADGTSANVATYAFANSTWSAVGDGSDLPGPVTAVEINNNNASSIFAAGRSTDNTTSFLSFWNGVSWTSVGSTLQSTTEVTQLRMVPLQNNHNANSVIETDRVLMVSGTISDSSFGNASTALFDGSSFLPYIVSTSQSGSPGVVAGLFASLSSFNFNQRHFLATGVVILISIAIAAGIVFLLALVEILWTLFARRDDKGINNYDPADTGADDDSTHRPSSLLEHINAATRTTILGSTAFGGAAAAAAATAHHEKGAGYGPAATQDDPFGGPDASNYVRADTPSDALGGALDGEDHSRPAHARYSFDGKGEGELPLRTGQELEILDDRDAAWWYARDTRTGQEGVVPAAYVY
ncbi:cortical protein marker for cell polarity-domain-containing protein [Epithele typhae]|uniref:cortical protein marker for cell polarity-domain-containing protein n=1 Tax=Epithele typhae TaxID=378194 RepID=UPI002008BC7D|nr:cortical protein marker for cell polarity-domain-containing protein [Epithele typhae]KAH9942312.1 cortical protein marker for cell polarity-domain-containing protein [Epithele typhae]